MSEKMPEAISESSVVICGITLRVYQLDDGRRAVNADDTALLFEAFACGATLDNEAAARMAEAFGAKPLSH